MKLILVYKKPFGVLELDNVVSIESGTANAPIGDSFIVEYVSGGSTVRRTFSTSDVVLQLI